MCEMQMLDPFEDIEDQCGRSSLSAGGRKGAHLNVNSVANKHEKIRNYIKENDYDIFAITETKIPSPEPEKLDDQQYLEDQCSIVRAVIPSGYKMIHRPRLSGHASGGVALIFKSEMELKENDRETKAYTSFEHICAMFKNGIAICVIYRPPHKHKDTIKRFEAEFKHLLYFVALKKDVSNVILLGDFNFPMNDLDANWRSKEKLARDFQDYYIKINSDLRDRGMSGLVQLVPPLPTCNSGNTLDLIFSLNVCRNFPLALCAHIDKTTVQTKLSDKHYTVGFHLYYDGKCWDEYVDRRIQFNIEVICSLIPHLETDLISDRDFMQSLTLLHGYHKSQANYASLRSFLLAHHESEIIFWMCVVSQAFNTSHGERLGELRKKVAHMITDLELDKQTNIIRHVELGATEPGKNHTDDSIEKYNQTIRSLQQLLQFLSWEEINFYLFRENK